eukprot:2591709-Rhodomonas_salina.1
MPSGKYQEVPSPKGAVLPKKRLVIVLRYENESFRPKICLDGSQPQRFTYVLVIRKRDLRASQRFGAVRHNAGLQGMRTRVSRLWFHNGVCSV